MRKIKFRFWNIKEKQMLQGSECFSSNQFDLNYWLPMQFTGLKDKNGREIYEGDIILSEGISLDVYFEIGFGDDYDKEVFGFILKSIRSKMKLNYPLCRDVEKYEVIGNIYENQEFAKNKDEVKKDE